MGDIADYYSEQEIDDFMSERDLSENYSNLYHKTCRYCNKKHLRWGSDKNGEWQLFDKQGKQHMCKKKPGVATHMQCTTCKRLSPITQWRANGEANGIRFACPFCYVAPPPTPDPTLLGKIPSDITEAAIKITNFFEENGVHTWEYAGLCSRNHAIRLNNVKRALANENPS